MALESFISLIKPICQEIFKAVVKAAHSNNKILKVNEKNIEAALTQHLTKVNTFTSEISFKEISNPKPIHSIYIPLDLKITNHEAREFDKTNSPKSTNVKSAIEIIEFVFENSNNNIIIVGTPGSGKTTTLKFICQQLFSDENFLKGQANFPILIRFREDELLSNKEIPLFQYILNVFGIIVENATKNGNNAEDHYQLNLFKRQIAIQIINEYSPLLVLDGIDEVSDEGIKDKLIKNINELSLSASNAKFVLTTRKGEDRFHIENTRVFELSPLSDFQIDILTNKWLESKSAVEFLSQLYNSSVYDSAKRPLTLSHLCAIYEREGRIPEKSRSIYRKIVDLLITHWNTENKINRTSKFSGFEPDRKKEFLENLAFEMSVLFNKNQFDTDDLKKCYGNLYVKFNLPYIQMPEVINEIQVHNGLITQIDDDKFEFAHKSFQEYLAAEHIVKLPKLPVQYNLFKIPSEMALTVNLSSEPTDYLSYFIEDYLLKNNCDYKFLRSFFTRIRIEKPDFSESRNFGILLLRLQNKYCSDLIESMNNKLNNSISNLFSQYYNDLEEAFKNLKYFENIKNSIYPIGQYYKASSETLSDTNFFALKYFREDIEIELPETLYITKQFYLDFIRQT